MAGMRGLGRVTNVLVAPNNGTISTAGGTIIASFKECSGIELIAYASPATAAAGGTITVNAGTTAASARATNYTTTLGFGQPTTFFSQNVGNTVSSNAGTVAWQSNTATWTSNTFVVGGPGTVSVIDFLTSQMADTYDYIAFSATAGVSLTAILYDLTVQRKPANLANAGS